MSNVEQYQHVMYVVDIVDKFEFEKRVRVYLQPTKQLDPKISNHRFDIQCYVTSIMVSRFEPLDGNLECLPLFAYLDTTGTIGNVDVQHYFIVDISNQTMLPCPTMNALEQMRDDELVGELKELARFNLTSELVADTQEYIDAEVACVTFDEQGKPCPRPVPPKMEFALRLYFCGLSASEACRQANIDRSWFHVWLRKPETKAILNQVRGELEDRFMSLQYKVTKVIETGLEDPNPAVSIKAAQTWLTSARAQKHTVELTAEDIIAKLIQ